MSRRGPYCWLLTLSLMMVMATPTPTLADTPPELSYPRLLRKITLTLRGTVPSAAEYQAIIDAPDDATKEILFRQRSLRGLPPTHSTSRSTGSRGLFGTAEYRQGLLDSQWLGSLAVNLSVSVR